MQEREGEADEPADGPKASRECRDQTMARVRLRSRLSGLGRREAGRSTKGRDPELLAAVASIAAHNRLRHIRFGTAIVLRREDCMSTSRMAIDGEAVVTST